MQMAPFIEDYYNEIHDQATAIELVKLNKEYQDRLNAIDKQEKSYAPPPRLSMESVTNRAKKIDFNALRRQAENEAKHRVAQIASPHVEDKDKLAELQKKHAPDPEYLKSLEKGGMGETIEQEQEKNQDNQASQKEESPKIEPPSEPEEAVANEIEEPQANQKLSDHELQQQNRAAELEKLRQQFDQSRSRITERDR